MDYRVELDGNIWKKWKQNTNSGKQIQGTVWFSVQEMLCFPVLTICRILP